MFRHAGPDEMDIGIMKPLRRTSVPDLLRPQIGEDRMINDNYSGKGQTDDGKPRPSEDDIQRSELGPRGVPGKPDPGKMTPQREKKTPRNVDPGHTA